MTTNVLNIFSLATEGLRRDKRDIPTQETVRTQAGLGITDESKKKSAVW